MKILVTPSYYEIFKEKEPTLKNIVSKIPSLKIIEIISFLNAQLYLNDSLKNQYTILKILLNGIEENIRSKIINNYSIFFNENKGANISLFSRLYLTYLLHFELCNYRETKNYKKIKDFDLNFLKAYLLISTIKNEEISSIYFNSPNNDSHIFFQAKTWPILIDQIDSNYLLSPISSMIRAFSFFKYFENNDELFEFLENFLKLNQKSNSLEYIGHLTHILKESWKLNEKGIRSNRILCDEYSESLFNNLVIKIDDYKNYYINKTFDFIGLKEKPLIKIEDKFFVLDWNLISNKIYDGLVFDFFNNSGIKNLNKLNSIPKFKKLIGMEVTEKLLFRNILKYIFNKKGPLIFPDESKNGFPDAYYRNGNSIVLFEIKDAFFPRDTIVSGEYDTIKKSIDDKYNNNKKGTGQLIKQIIKLKEDTNHFEKSKCFKVNSKRIKIYPIIIFTDIHFGMPGISNYILNEFNNKINSISIRNDFKEIKNVTFLNIESLVQNSLFLKRNNFIDVLNTLHRKLELKKIKSEKFNDLNLEIEYQKNFDQIFNEEFKIKKEDRISIKELSKFWDEKNI